jgi:hypothetical protein
MIRDSKRTIFAIFRSHCHIHNQLFNDLRIQQFRIPNFELKYPKSHFLKTKTLFPKNHVPKRRNSRHLFQLLSLIVIVIWSAYRCNLDGLHGRTWANKEDPLQQRKITFSVGFDIKNKNGVHHECVEVKNGGCNLHNVTGKPQFQ